MDLVHRTPCDQSATGCQGLDLSHRFPQRLKVLGWFEIDRALCLMVKIQSVGHKENDKRKGNGAEEPHFEIIPRYGSVEVRLRQCSNPLLMGAPQSFGSTFRGIHSTNLLVELGLYR